MEKSLAYVRTNIGEWGVASVVFCATGVVVPPKYPLCAFMPLSADFGTDLQRGSGDSRQ